jgi:hypothetical protein
MSPGRGRNRAPEMDVLALEPSQRALLLATGANPWKRGGRTSPHRGRSRACGVDVLDMEPPQGALLLATGDNPWKRGPHPSKRSLPWSPRRGRCY